MPHRPRNRKPIARLYFDRKVPRIGIFDSERQEQFFDLGNIEGIYEHSDLLRARVASLRDS